MKKKELLIGLCIAVVSVLFALGTIEAYYQFTYTPPGEEPFESSIPLGWENRKSFSQTFYDTWHHEMISQIHNSLGIRDKREFGQKEKPRLVIIGDSFVYGTGLDQDEMIGRRLQEKLPGWEVISAGTIGYSTTQYLQYYKERIRPLKPDIVVFAVFLNDWGENFFPIIFGHTKPWTYRVNQNGSLVKAFHPQRFRPLLPVPPKPKLFLLNKLKEALSSLKTKPPEPYLTSPYRVNQAWFMFEEPYGNEQNAAVIVEQEVLRLAKETVEADNATFIALYIPHQLQTDAAYRERTMAGFSDTALLKFLWMKPTLLMHQYQKLLGFRLVDLTPTIGMRKDVSSLYLPDGHLSPKGTALVDKTLLEYLKKERLVS